MQDFSFEGGGSGLGDFRGSGQIFAIGRSPEMWANFLKMCIKIIKNKSCREKFKFLTTIFIFVRGRRFGEHSPPKLENFSIILSKTSIAKFIKFSKISMDF